MRQWGVGTALSVGSIARAASVVTVNAVWKAGLHVGQSTPHSPWVASHE